MGEDYATDTRPQTPGVNDRMLAGGAAAFAADAQLWRAVLYETSNAQTPWILETLTRDHLRASGLTLSRSPLAYCILSVHGACRYLGELWGASTSLGLTLLSGRPQLCGLVPQRPCDAEVQRSVRAPPALAHAFGQQTRRQWICLLGQRCVRAKSHGNAA